MAFRTTRKMLMTMAFFRAKAIVMTMTMMFILEAPKSVMARITIATAVSIATMSITMDFLIKLVMKQIQPKRFARVISIATTTTSLSILVPTKVATALTPTAMVLWDRTN